MTVVRRRAERGETLVELLVTVAILGIAVITIVLGMATALTASDAHRKQATVETLLRGYAEALADPGVAYAECATTASYATNPPGLTVPAGYAVSIAAVRYWDGNNPAAFGGTCPANPDKGSQLLTLHAQSTDGRGTKSLDVVKRRP